MQFEQNLTPENCHYKILQAILHRDKLSPDFLNLLNTPLPYISLNSVHFSNVKTLIFRNMAWPLQVN